MIWKGIELGFGIMFGIWLFYQVSKVSPTAVARIVVAAVLLMGAVGFMGYALR